MVSLNYYQAYRVRITDIPEDVRHNIRTVYGEQVLHPDWLNKYESKPYTFKPFVPRGPCWKPEIRPTKVPGNRPRSLTKVKVMAHRATRRKVKQWLNSGKEVERDFQLGINNWMV